eukprot:TRINITY_DN101730_c0_g1_i1.p1 TRINITY_DN101730_c0_g1~~TRINITY_DN101730_c0_g1_i1.p1  ORF type:complete len:651 (+),score=71.76 TRINITY_DN101730_c0_g1_i1:71-2023(+)
MESFSTPDQLPPVPILVEPAFDPREVGFPTALRNLVKAQEEELCFHISSCFLHHLDELEMFMKQLINEKGGSMNCLSKDITEEGTRARKPKLVFEAFQRSGHGLDSTKPADFDLKSALWSSDKEPDLTDACFSVVTDALTEAGVDEHSIATEIVDEKEIDGCYDIVVQTSRNYDEFGIRSRDYLSFRRRDSEVAKQAHAMHMSSAEEVRGLAAQTTLELSQYSMCTSPLAQRILRVPAFEKICAVCICLNALIVGLQVEYSAAYRTRGMPFSYRACEYVTISWFVVEFTVRLLASGCSEFWWRSHDVGWNYLDTFVIFASAIDTVILVADVGDQGGALIALRLVRIVRLVRIAKLVSFFHSLRVMVYSMFHTLKSLLCFLVLMCLFTYTFAVCLTQGAVDHAILLLGEGTDWTDLADDGPLYVPRLLQDFGSVPRTMFTLLQCVTGGVSWGEPATIVAHWGALFMVAFLIYITFTIFAMLNVITGFFCEDAAAMMAKDKSEAIMQQLNHKDEYLRQFRLVFKEIDADRSGQMTYEELNEHIQDPSLQAYFSHLEIEAQDAWEIFRLLDVDGSGTISDEEFVYGCMKLRGYAKTLDVASINYDIERLRRKTFERFDRLEQVLRSLLSGNTKNGSKQGSKQPPAYYGSNDRR